MEQDTVVVIEKLAEIAGKNSEVIISAYSKWYLTAGLWWVLFGATLFLFGRFFKLPGDNLDESEKKLSKVIGWVISFVGLLWIGVNLPDVISSEGIAIHRLIADIRGN